MTPNRSKRSSKVPERFSSEDLRIETSNSNGVTIFDYNDKSTSTTHRLAPINTKIKLKPVIREPLKVKLPKLKRPASSESTKSQAKFRQIKNATTSKDDDDSHSGLTDSFDIEAHKLSKIKLPSKNRTTSTDDKKASKSQANRVNDNQQKSSQQLIEKGNRSSDANSATQLNQNRAKNDLSSASELDCSTDKHNNSAEESFNSSSSSDDTNSGRMQIIMGGQVQNDSSISNGNDSGIRCPCGVDADLGVMVECEKCSTWQHGHCINVGPEEDAYEGYICAFCLYPQGKHGESLHQLTVGDKFQQKFDQLTALLSEQIRSNDNDKLNNENRVHFSIDELSEATKDLKRVANSLDVKWKLYLNQEYPTELKIWTNALWSERHEENLKQKRLTNCFFGDIYRGNLELNIRNMIRKISQRIELINNQISTYAVSESILDDANSKKLTCAKKLLDEVKKLVELVRMSLGNVN